MSTFSEIKTTRRLIWTGIAIGYLLAVGAAAAVLTNGDDSPLVAVAFLAGFSIPPTLALVSLDRRPSLLTLAGMAAVMQGVILITSVGLIELVPAILWYLASKRRPRPAIAPDGAAWIRPLLAVGAIVPVLAMFLHLDPVCQITAPDGSVTEVAYDGAATGWGLSLGAITSTATSDEGEKSCSSDRVLAWEALVSIGLAVTYLGLVLSKWPTAETLTGRSGDRHRANGLRA